MFTMMSNKKLLFFVLIATLLLIGCSKKQEIVYNQCGIDGVITDWSLSPNPSAVLVSIENSSDNTQTHTAVSDGDGKFRFRDIVAGKYKISIKKDGYGIWGTTIDGVLAHHNRWIELQDNKIKNLEIIIKNENQPFEHLDLSDIYGHPINESIHITKYSPVVAFKLHNGTSNSLCFNVSNSENCFIYCTCMPYTYGMLYIFKSFSPTSGEVKPGEEVVLIGEVDMDFYDFCYDGAPTYNNYYHTLRFWLGGTSSDQEVLLDFEL